MEGDIYSIELNEVSKSYKIYNNSYQKLLDLLSPKGAGKTFYALKNISFKVPRGEVVGIIGLNGSGKSTLSNILSGISLPSNGSVSIKGEAALIAIGLGLNNFLTGIENIEVKALMMGYKKHQIDKIKKNVIEFADIGDFINQPIRTYSSGMRSRLGFAISINMNPDVIVIDEALSVGDPTFTQKCLDKMNEFKKEGKTIFFVSHALSQIRQFCTKAIWLEYGTLREYGDVNDVLPKYSNYIKVINEMTDKEKSEYKKGVLQIQEHILLKEFKIIDSKFKKINPEGKILKNVYLINKTNSIKAIPYSIDIVTCLFGFIPSLIRKRYSIALIILLMQSLCLFIIPYPISILFNFLITFIFSIFTGKDFISDMIERRGYLDYTVWNEMELDDKLKRKAKKDKRTSKRKVVIEIIIMMVFLICIIASILIWIFFLEKNPLF